MHIVNKPIKCCASSAVVSDASNAGKHMHPFRMQILDGDEVLELPIVGDFFKERSNTIPQVCIVYVCVCVCCECVCECECRVWLFFDIESRPVTALQQSYL